MPNLFSILAPAALLTFFCSLPTLAAQPEPVTANTRQALRLTPGTLRPAGPWGAIFKGDDGKDTRQPMTSKEYPWSTIGLITLDLGNDTASFCTGTLVGRRVMLTAAHCVLKGRKIHGITFEASYMMGANNGSAQSGWITVGTTEPDTYRSADWAVVELDEPLGDQQGWMGTTTLDHFSLPLKVAYAGYSDNFAKGEVAGAETGCYIRDLFSNGTYGHDCSEGPGGSGGPLFLNDGEEGARVVAVNTRGVTGGVYSHYISANANIAVMTSTLVDTINDFQKRFP